MNTQTGKIAFGGVLVALGVGCMLLTNVVPIATYALPLSLIHISEPTRP